MLSEVTHAAVIRDGLTVIVVLTTQEVAAIHITLVKLGAVTVFGALCAVAVLSAYRVAIIVTIAVVSALNTSAALTNISIVVGWATTVSVDLA